MAGKVDPEITCLPPAEVDGECAKLFKRLVLATGEVSKNAFPSLYTNALILCFTRVNGSIAGVGAIKRPKAAHRAKVFKLAKSAIAPDSFDYELGWFHVLRRFKGNKISSRMVEALMPWAEGASIYATSRVNNGRMHSALTEHGRFVPEGSDYRSEQRPVLIRLFVRRVRPPTTGTK